MWSLLSQTPNKEWKKGEKIKSKGMCSFCHAGVGVNFTLYSEGFAVKVTQRLHAELWIKRSGA